MDEDLFLAAVARRKAAFLAYVFTDEAKQPVVERALEREYIFGLHKEPKVGETRMLGSRRVPQSYIYEKGKRVSTTRSQRFSAK